MYCGWSEILFFVWIKNGCQRSVLYQLRIKKKSSENEKETEKATASTKSLNEYLFEKRNEKKKYKVTQKTSSTDRRKSMSWENCKTVDGSVTIEIGFMDTSKGSLELVRGSKLRVKVGKDMAADEVLAQKNIQITISFFRGWKTTYFFILIANVCTIYLVQMSLLLLQNIKNSLANRIQKYAFIFPKMKSTSPVYSKHLQIQ